MKTPSTLLLLAAALGSAACSTKLEVTAIPVWQDPARDHWAGDPERLAVNRLGLYQASVTAATESIAVTPGSCCVRLVDPHHLLRIDYERMPFADGNLTLELAKDTQIPTKIGVKGTTPATNVVKAAESGLDASRKLGGP